MRRLCRTSAHDHAAVGTLRERCNPPLNLSGIPHVDGAQLQAKRWRKRLDCAEQAGTSRDAELPKNRHSRHLRRDLLEQLQPGNDRVTTGTRNRRPHGHCERLIGSIRRECLDHIVVFGERHLRRLLRAYADYYTRNQLTCH